jgi:hypothetical protein
MLSDRVERERLTPPFMTALTRYGLLVGEVYVTAGSVEASAIWRPPSLIRTEEHQRYGFEIAVDWDLPDGGRTSGSCGGDPTPSRHRARAAYATTPSGTHPLRDLAGGGGAGRQGGETPALTSLRGISRIGPSAKSPDPWLVYAARSRDTHGMQRRSGSPGGTIDVERLSQVVPTASDMRPDRPAGMLSRMPQRPPSMASASRCGALGCCSRNREFVPAPTGRIAYRS